MTKLGAKFCADLKRKEFIPLKVLNLVVYGGLLTLFPFLTIHARSIGITESQFGTISGILPLICLLVPAVTGMLADKIGNFKWFVCGMMALNGISGLLFLAVPTMESAATNNKVDIELRCTLRGNSAILVDTPSCHFSDKKFKILLKNCIFNCERMKPDLDIRGTGDWCGITNKCISNLAYDSFTVKESHTLSGRINAESYNSSSDSSLVETDFCPDVAKIETLDDYSSDLRFQSCQLSCYGSLSKYEACLADRNESKSTDMGILALYTAIRICNAILLASSFPLLEAAIVAVVKEKRGDFGFQRLFSNIGIIIVTPLSGFLIDMFSTEEKANFSPAFYLYCGLNCLSAIIILFVDLKFKSPSQTVVEDLKKLMTNIQVILLLFVCLTVGIALGVIDTFLFWLLEDLGAGKSLMGLTVTVGASFGIPILFFSTQILDKFGCANCITLGVAVFVLRLIGYSIIPTAWWAMPFEALECFTTSLFQVSVITYAAVLATPSTIATLQGILTGTLHGVGRGLGSLIGGFMIAAIGVRKAFLVMAGICAVTSIFYGVTNKILIGSGGKIKSITQDGDGEKVTKETVNQDQPELNNSKV